MKSLIRVLSRAFTKRPSQDPLKQIITINKELVEAAPKDLMQDYTNKKTDLPLQQFSPQSQTRLILENNPLALELLSTRKFELEDPRLTIKSADMDLEMPGVKQISLGTSQVKLKGQVLLRDVDPLNIPQDKDIIFSAFKKDIVLLGKSSNQPVTDQTMEIQPSAFQEKSLREHLGQYLLPGQDRLAVLNWREVLRAMFRYGLLLWAGSVWAYTYLEYRNVRRQQQLLELQQEEQGAMLRKKAILQLIENDQS